LLFSSGYLNQPIHPPQHPPNIQTKITVTQNDQPSLSATHQTLITHDIANAHWGDTMHCPKPFNTFRVLARNVNTMSNATDYLSWKAATQAVTDSKADVITFQETNLAWNKIH